MPFALLFLAQEKERNARRKKKKIPAVQNEEAAFPPAAEDEEMGQDGSGTSGNEEEMTEEAEGKVDCPKQSRISWSSWSRQVRAQVGNQVLPGEMAQDVFSVTWECHGFWMSVTEITSKQGHP